jgi:hypothetical protein
LTRPHLYARVPFSRKLIANYEDFVFEIGDKQYLGENEVVEFTTGLIDQKRFVMLPVARLYIRYQDEGAVLLPDMPETMAKKLCEDASWESHPGRNGETTVYRRFRSMMEFRSNKLAHATFRKSEAPFAFAKSPNGPFVSLPMTRERMVEVFGKPKRWEWGNRVTSP